MEEQQTRTAPVAGDNGQCFCHITWITFIKAYKIYKEKYEGNFSVDRIIDQGGFTEEELDEFFPEWKDYIIEDEPLKRILKIK
jgi:hypothetical protein